jgi:hypothetical protein
MALTLGNPLIITSSMATSYKTQLAAASPNAGKNNTSYGTLTSLLIEKIEWLSPVTVGDSIVIGDPQSGLNLLTLVCETALQSQIIDWTSNPKLWLDFEINQFSSGTLKIWTR